MFTEVKLSDIESDGFLHSHVDEFTCDNNKKMFVVKLTGADLNKGGIFYNCIITITDWWDLEVYEYNKVETVRFFNLDSIPELNQILDFSFNNDELIFTGIGLHNNTAIDYKFVKPKIQITGEYEPD